MTVSDTKGQKRDCAPPDRWMPIADAPRSPRTCTCANSASFCACADGSWRQRTSSAR